MLNNATPHHIQPRRRSADAPAAGVRHARLDSDAASVVRTELPGSSVRDRLAA